MGGKRLHQAPSKGGGSFVLDGATIPMSQETPTELGRMGELSHRDIVAGVCIVTNRGASPSASCRTWNT
jgi:hypothetical protein